MLYLDMELKSNKNEMKISFTMHDKTTATRLGKYEWKLDSEGFISNKDNIFFRTTRGTIVILYIYKPKENINWQFINMYEVDLETGENSWELSFKTKEIVWNILINELNEKGFINDKGSITDIYDKKEVKK
jgi:hypothetical protein